MQIKDMIKLISPVAVSLSEKVLDDKIVSLSFDSRKVENGSVFFAYKGNSFDSTDDAIKLYKENKITLIVSAKALDKSMNHIVVTDVRQALSIVANAYFDNPLTKYRSVAITGTNGKTTTTYILESIFKAFGKTCVKVGTNGVFIADRFYETANTTPSGHDIFSYLDEGLRYGANYFVMELSSHALEQKRITGVKFDVAVFTNLTQDHLDYHKDMESYFAAKSILFTTGMAKHKVINIGSPYGERLVKLSDKNLLTYAVEKKADIFSKNYELTPDGIKANIHIFDNDIDISSSLIGHHNLENILAAIAAAKILNISDAAIIDGVAALKSVDGRLQKVDDKDFKIFVDYAHTDDALRNVLSSLKAFKPHKLIVVFGAGGDRDKSKRPLMAKAVEAFADTVIVTSDNPRTENKDEIIKDILSGFNDKSKVLVIPNRDEAIKKAVSLALRDDIVLLAGKGHEKYQIIGNEKLHFDDIQTALKYVKN